ncbi:hypothetical protein [Bradyrhizobium liaoningense]
MAKVTVCQWTKYDIANDESRKSRRWATREAVRWAGGTVLENTCVEVDASLVGGEVEGMTLRGFNPHAHTGFQRQVTS